MYKSLQNYSGHSFLCPDETTVARYNAFRSNSELRAKKGVSQEIVYEDTGIHIGKIETARYNITVSTLSKLCNYYGTSLKEFFNELDQ